MTKPGPNSEVSFILQVKGAGFLHLSKTSSEKQKKTVTADKGQTIARLSCLTVTVTRLFRQFFGLGLCPTTPAGLFPQSEYIPP